MLYHKNTLKVYLAFALTCLPFLCFGSENGHVIRAAIDIGSGATKLKIAEINLNTRKIEKILVNENFPVQYEEELEESSDNAFNEQVMSTGLDALKKSKEIALKYNAQNVIAIATASFRKAVNAQEFIDRVYKETGIRIHIIDQDLEGILAFEATASQVKTPAEDLIVWDIGGGSFQFSALGPEGTIHVYRGTEASIPFKNHVIKTIKMEDPHHISTPNPLDPIDIKDAEYNARQTARKVDTFFKSKICDRKTKVIGIGNIFAYRIYPLIGKKDSFTQRELYKEVENLAGKTDKDLGNDPYVNVSVTNPILVLGFMQALKIDKMDVMDINNADGALLYSAFWDEGPSAADYNSGF